MAPPQSEQTPVWNEFVSQVSRALSNLPKEKLAVPQKAASAGADLSASIAFELARERKQPPFKIAEELVSSIDLSNFPLIERVENKGGYLNFFANRGAFLSRAVAEAASAGDGYGNSKAFSGRSALVEFPSVNPNKPWHIGHARNAVLGDTLSRILAGAGYSVTRMDYIDNLGLQVAKVYWGMKNLADRSRHPKFDQNLGLLYVDVEAESGKNPAVEAEIRTIMHGMEHGIEPAAPEARALAEACVRAQYLTAYRFGIFHDLQIYESEIISAGLFSKALEKMLSTGVVKRAETGEKAGCIVCDVSGFAGFENLEDTEVVLVRSDGTATYAAKDVAFQLWKFGLFENPFLFAPFERQPNGAVVKKSSLSGERIDLPKYDLVINVIGAEQAHPQRIVYSILGKLGFESEESRSFHLSYEHVWLPEGKFSGRKGTWVGFSVDEVLDEAVERARAEVEARNPTLPDEEKAGIAEAVGIGAVRYTLLKFAPEKKITFRWEDALSFDGDSAPYLQYALARCLRILEKAGKAPPAELSESELSRIEEDEHLLAKQVALLPAEISRIAGSLRKEVWGTRTELARISEYSFQLATLLSRFYTTCRVLGSEHEARRLALVRAASIALRSGLTFLGIPLVERM